MAILDGLKGVVINWLGVIPATQEVNIVVRENVTHEVNTLKNQLWYRGDPVELEQFFKTMAESTQFINSDIPATRFWAATPSGTSLVRKIHSGVPGMITDKLADIVTTDMMEPTGKEDILNKWAPISKAVEFNELVNQAIVDTLALGDGAFKIAIDTELSEYPMLEFYAGNNVTYTRRRGKLTEIQFYADYYHGAKHYKLVEHYGIGYVKYEIKDDMGVSFPTSTIPETDYLKDVTFAGDFIMGVPLRIYRSAKWDGRGDSIFERKSDMFDALDETISTWLDAVRAGRVKQYIPSNMVPKNSETGADLKPDVFNNYITTGAVMTEDFQAKIETVQGQVEFQGLMSTYLNFLDSCLQGIISPSTLGIDVKKLDNAESQREKEKTTMYTRDKIIGALQKVLPEVANMVLKTYANMTSQVPQDSEISFEFGQYANPSFEATVETMSKAKQAQLMSTEKIVEELYGDSMKKEDKAEEVERIKAEYSPTAASPSFAPPYAMNQEPEE